jgi:hypothetical protein
MDQNTHCIRTNLQMISDWPGVIALEQGAASNRPTANLFSIDECHITTVNRDRELGLGRDIGQFHHPAK